MGRSNSCFKIITCGSDSAEKTDVEVSENKGSSDRRGWSFRKRSARHRVLSNTVTSETHSSGNKESPESACIDFQMPANSTVPEKVSTVQWPDEKTLLSTSMDSKVSDTVVAPESQDKAEINLENEITVDLDQESLVIVIQTAIRGFLAQRMLLKFKNVIKLQAAVRGHLVRRHAVGTLRCVQAIVKLQALVRARRARVSSEGSYLSSKPLVTDNSISKLNDATPTSIEKILSNGFARQLLESTPRSKPINIKCDPSKSNSAWKWLERWMSVSSSNLAEPDEPKLNLKQVEQLKVKHSFTQVEVEEAPDTTSCVKDAAVPFESEESLITYDAGKFEFQAVNPTSDTRRENLEQSWPENIGTSNAEVSSTERETLQNQSTQLDESSLIELNPLPGNSVSEIEQAKQSTKRFDPEQLDTEGKMVVFGSKKTSNPTFIAAQSKFEELSSTVNSGRSISSSYQDVGNESNQDAVSSVADSAIGMKEFSLVENYVSKHPRIQIGGSDCGTELSISSTLDSPDRSEAGAVEFEHEPKALEEKDCNANSTENVGVEVHEKSDSSYSFPVQPEKIDDVIGESADSVVVMDPEPVKLKPERSAFDKPVEVGSYISHQANKSSPEASPRSHITVPESQGTPASQVSVNAKRNRTDKSGSNHKRMSLITDKNSPSNPNHDSGARSSSEQTPKDQKTGKRRNSFGFARAENVDQEPRDSSSSNSLPSYMQTTESARAKVHAANSPRSSPDVQDKDIYVKKRHSLPAMNGRQGSPRVQRSLSQAQQGAKGNSVHPPHERKWQR